MNPKQPPTPPATAKDRQDGGAWNPSNGPRPNNPQNPNKPETPLAQPNTILQLYNFWQRVPKDVLKDVLADGSQQEVVERGATGGKDDGFHPLHGGPLPSTVGTVSNPNGQGPNDDANNGGRPLPPPGYREPYKDFTKLLSPGEK